jgi:diguanylate cyclase (GGDEF)-like protein
VAQATLIEPHLLAGITALVLALMSLLVYLYRRRLFILWSMGAWSLLAASMLPVSVRFENEHIGGIAYGISQFLGVLGALAFVVAADAYRQKPQITRNYALLLLPVAIYFVFLPVALTPAIVFSLGHLLIAGGMAAAAVAHLLLLRQARLLGATIVGVALFTLSGINVYMGLSAGQPDSTEVTTPLIAMTVVFLFGALGQQLLAFEDMTYELSRTNRRLETAQAELREMVITDPLTGTRNRRFFDAIIGRELQQHGRDGRPLSIVFIDIDRFKAINDTLGHETGDRVLREVAGFLLRNIREADYVFRWGGDEFLVLMSCGEAEAVRRATNLQASFAASPQIADLPPGVALSVGCVEVPAETDDILPLVQMADERMYVNKKRRR